MTTVVSNMSSPHELRDSWLQDLQANDRASGSIRRYKSAIENFLS